MLSWGYLVQLQLRQSSIICQVLFWTAPSPGPGSLCAPLSPPCFWPMVLCLAGRLLYI